MAIARALDETRALYRLADAAYARATCPASAQCCQLAQRQREPWLWPSEWLLLEAAWRSRHDALPEEHADGACPFLDRETKHCSLYADRPFGCRTYFCERMTGLKNHPTELVMRLLARLEHANQRCWPDVTAPRPLTRFWRDARAGALELEPATRSGDMATDVDSE